MAIDAPASPIAGLLEKLPPIDQAFLRDAAKVDTTRVANYATAEHYYDGDVVRTVQLTDRLREFLETSGLPYNENFCETVVDALAARLRISGVTSDNEEFASYVWDVLWDRNRLDAHQGTIFTETLKLGDAYLIVDFDAVAGHPCVKLNGPERCKVEYVDGEKWYAAKTWDTAAKGPLNPAGQALVRLNVYWPDRIEKYFRLSSDDAGSWGVWVDEGDESWPLDWTAPDGQPLGIPVFHFANKPGRRKFGRAEHWGTIPQQDALTKELVDLALILDTQGYPQRWATGLAPKEKLTTNPGEVWTTESREGQFGQFDAAPLTGPLAAIESSLMRIAARSHTPVHLLVPTSTPPSGESQKAAEAGLVAKARDRAALLGEEWIAVFRMMATLGALYATPESPYRPPLDVAAIRDVALNVQWVDPETRNEKDHLDALVIMAGLGVSERTLLSMIPGIDAEAELAQKQVEDAAKAQHMLAAMAAGQLPPGAGQPAAPGASAQPAAAGAVPPVGTDGIALPAPMVRAPHA